MREPRREGGIGSSRDVFPQKTLELLTLRQSLTAQSLMGGSSVSPSSSRQLAGQPSDMK